MKLFIPAILVGCSMAFAEINKSGETAPTSKKEYCAKIKNPEYVKGLLYSTSNQIAFRNQGGLLNGGVCWWHSMLTRNAQYLAVYRPDLPKPTSSEAWQIVNYLSANRGVVEIPGYRNFREFTYDHADTVLHALEGWQIVDGSIGFGWLRGLSGSSQVGARELKTMMDETYRQVKSKKRVIYQKLQQEGIASHAWLVVDMEKTPDGYILEVVDSNYSGVQRVSYRYGMTQMRDYAAVPYTSRNSGDYTGYSYSINQYCRFGNTAADLDRTKNREY